MTRRQQLHSELKSLGLTNVYFQPPENVKLIFPCLIYKMVRLSPEYADNIPYAMSKRYNLLYITKDPDDTMPETLAWHFPSIIHNTSYVNDTLYHHSFDLYY